MQHTAGVVYLAGGYGRMARGFVRSALTLQPDEVELDRYDPPGGTVHERARRKRGRRAPLELRTQERGGQTGVDDVLHQDDRTATDVDVEVLAELVHLGQDRLGFHASAFQWSLRPNKP